MRWAPPRRQRIWQKYANREIISTMTKQVRKPVKWVSSAKRDLDAMPEDVKDVFGHAIDLAQAGGRHDFDTWPAQQGVRR
jgi:phage-related protein